VKRKPKQNRRQLPLFPGFDARQTPLFPRSEWATAITPKPPARCTCLDEGEIGRLDAIGGLTNERIFKAENN
jgi:hypothetical protein